MKEKAKQEVGKMELDEAIKHCEEKACGNTECNQEHQQLTEWLKLLKWYEEALHAYYCSECEERFHIEKILPPSHVVCPYCGSDDVAINSKDYGKL